MKLEGIGEKLERREWRVSLINIICMYEIFNRNMPTKKNESIT